MPDTHYTEWFHFTSQALPQDACHVVRFSGTEGLNSLFSFTIELVSEDAALDTEAMLNSPAEFVILRDNGEHAVFRGYPARVDQAGHFHGFTFYTVDLRPAFWKLTQVVQSAVFLNKNAQETANALLNSQRFFSFPHEFHLIRDYPSPEFAMQYEESLYDYILFRMEEQGAYFYFAPDGDKIIFADAPQSHSGSSLTLSYSPASGLDANRREEVLQTFVLSRTPLPRQVVLRCYDWKNPNRVIVGKADVSATGLGDVYLAGENAESQAEANRLAKIRAEELICRSRVFTGAGSVPVLRPGVVFTLADHYSPPFNRDYLVTEITHEGAQEAYISLGLGIPLRDAADHLFYRNSFTCIPADVPFRPKRTAPRAKISGVLRAFVDGAANKRAEMDEYGRYKLLFPFDVSGRKGGNASCWIRMAGPQANRDSGLAFPLLPGTEVVVSFIDGDPDRPVITGALPNGETGSISGRGNANISGIRTAGGNQITFNDTDKQQGIALSTAAGLGYKVSSGSLGLTSEDSDAWFKAASVGGAEVAGAFKDVATGFKIRNAVYEHNSWYGWTTTGATALGGVTAGVLDALAAKKVGNKGEEAKWSSAAVKTLIPVLATGVGDIAFARDGSPSYYGAAINAQKDAVSSTIQVRPSAARLITMLVLWMTGRAAATGLGAITQDDKDDKDDKKDKKDDDAVYYGEVKADAIREVMVSATSELVAEVTALVTLVIARRKQATHLGGVSISSSDNNVNIRGKEAVSVHSETGILLDTTQRVGDAGKWGAPSALGMRQSLGDMWPDNTDVPKPQDAGKYVVVNAANGTLGLFAQRTQFVTRQNWVSEAQTHVLKSGQGNAPDAMLTIKDAADGSLEAKVSATGKILLTRGDANDGQSLTLSNNECILKNGSDVKYTLARATASLTTKNSALSMYSDSVSLRGKNATVECKPSAIDIDPGSSGSAKVCGITFQRTNLKADGALKLDAGIIKIG